MDMEVKNVFAELRDDFEPERFATLMENDGVRIERIISRSHSSPAGFWYDQADTEWVIVLRGHAALRFESGELVEMKTGDHITIPSRVKHRVEKTAAETVWLAVRWKHGEPKGDR